MSSSMRSASGRSAARWGLGVALAGFALLVVGHLSGLAAQYENTPPATLRAYAHLFAAYAIAWVLLLAWILRIARKLKQVSVDA